MMRGWYQAGHDARIVDSAAVVGVRDDDASFFSRQIYGVDEILAAIAGEFCKPTGFEPEKGETAGEAQRDGLAEAVESAVNVAERIEIEMIHVDENDGKFNTGKWLKARHRRSSRSP
jgi:hypothetical protein